MKKKLIAISHEVLGFLFPTRISTLAGLILPYIKDGDRVLDLGAGTGRIAGYVSSKKKVKITPMDVTDKNNETSLDFKV